MLCELDDGPKFAGHGDSTSPDHAAGPDRDTTGCERDSVGTTCDTRDNSANVSAKRPEWIVAESDFYGKHTSHAWHQHVAFDSEPEYDEQSWNYAQRVSVRHAPGKRAGNGGFGESSDFKPRL